MYPPACSVVDSRVRGGVAGRLIAAAAVTVTALMSAALCQAQTPLSNVPTAAPQSTSLFAGELTFKLPVGFSALTTAQITKQFPTTRKPQVVYDDHKQAIEIAVSHTIDRLPPDKLAEAESAMVQIMPKLRHDFIVIAHSRLSINGTQWVEIDGVNNAQGDSLDDEMLLTSLDNRLLIVNLIDDRSRTPASGKAELKTVQASLHLTGAVPPPSAASGVPVPTAPASSSAPTLLPAASSPAAAS